MRTWGNCVEKEVINCEACNQPVIKRIEVRSGLTYLVCAGCGHCLKEFTHGVENEFWRAQELYFGKDSNLSEHEPDAADREILAKRARAATAYLAQQKTILEVGPGAGLFSEWLQKKGYQIRLIEHSKILAKMLERKLDVKVETGQFETLEIEPASVDAFCSFHVIEHVTDPLLHLMAGFSAVRPGGIGMVATPNARSLQQMWFQRLSPNFDSAHLRVFSTDSLSAFCEKAGWQVECIETPEFTSGWLRVISKTLRIIRGEDENMTAGKYAKVGSSRFNMIYTGIAILTWPLRRIQQTAKRGNEVFVVLRKPNVKIYSDLNGSDGYNA